MLHFCSYFLRSFLPCILFGVCSLCACMRACSVSACVYDCMKVPTHCTYSLYHRQCIWSLQLHITLNLFYLSDLTVLLWSPPLTNTNTPRTLSQAALLTQPLRSLTCRSHEFLWRALRRKKKESIWATTHNVNSAKLYCTLIGLRLLRASIHWFDTECTP